MIIFAFWIVGILITSFEINNPCGFIMLGVLIFCGICVGLILYFKPSWREGWQLVVLVVELVYVVVGYAITDDESNDNHPIGCQCYGCKPWG